ncbi:hypothetical protein A2291_04245 [candidate division WOR-1 bacterium RIFOXYB2_FULL_42_35]|uniref:Glycosyltransferase 2-like domain-containing protein n=1 Tax=candidate division WOR-1 bacterium RIFOXYC2_FULL_41_25 TaxID=1802586 RepID=A0A1F4TMX9_UNCSA|nr:MAG: hypothetical protein A2247_01085 [candidate division WOR-1 bacterium RIFOXYA2_FULL_41_14]OGC24342.1 MAG: hypothetical protein A2291_04245 [candidate division WOR-1 bacterium RIFOXYB2_FULL_42_35]OGC34044.1 MAG: hypothetical protein A2462_01650 [candidate division WOR-1 bacterium RIFOXYC2_FULL_41_25]OGC43818.1 MAG: hypothetical protein A2548_07970 [candidate division WOR-1 bacterium RIFOXYD2_FULL_41_8]
MTDLSIIIVNWNVKKLLEASLTSIFANKDGLNIEVFVSDNASSDGSQAMVTEKFPQVKLIANKENLGFTKANNLAIEQSQGKYVLILNPDTEVLPGALTTMVKFMEEHADCGALGPRLLNADQSLQHSCRTFPTLETQLYTTLFLDGLLPKNRLFGKHMMTWWQHDDVRDVDQIMGAAMLIRKEILEKIGAFDENIIFWYDEVDLCYRIKKAGWKIFFTPQAQIVHYQGKSFKQWKDLKTSLRGAYLWRKSRNYFFRKHYGKWQVPVLMIMDLAQFAIIFWLLYFIVKLMGSLLP